MQKSELVGLLNKEQNQSEVARKLGYSKQYISWLIRKYGIKKKVKRKEDFFYLLKQKAVRVIWEYYLT